MDEVVITWSLQNWITIVLMVAVFFAIGALVLKGVKSVQAKGT